MGAALPEWVEDPERHAYWQVINGLADARLDPEDFYGPWRAAHDSGQPRPPAKLLAQLPDDLIWPMLEDWRERFGAGVPYMWRDRASPGTPLAPRLLMHTLGASARGMARLARYLEPWGNGGLVVGRPLPPSLTWRFQIMTDEPSNVQAVCRQGAEILSQGDWSALPPFFPGDRTGWDIVPTRRATPANVEN